MVPETFPPKINKIFNLISDYNHTTGRSYIHIVQSYNREQYRDLGRIATKFVVKVPEKLSDIRASDAYHFQKDFIMNYQLNINDA